MSYGSINSGSVSELTEQQIKDILSLAHPVGSLYISDDVTSPAELFGGTWEQIAKDRTLMGASDNHIAGSLIEAGLPDITGSIDLRPTGYVEHGLVWTMTTGALSSSVKGGSRKNERFINALTPSSTMENTSSISIKASNGNSIYGGSNTVQPPAYYSYIWKRLQD